MVLGSKEKSLSNRAWAAFCLLAALTWGSIFFASRVTDSYSLHTADLISRIAFASGTFTSLSFFAFALAFTERWESSRTLRHVLAGLAICLAATFLFTDLLTTGMIEIELGLRRPTPGPLIALYLLYTIFNTLGALVIFAIAYRRSSGHKRLQLRYALVAVVFAMVAGVGSLIPSIGASTYLDWVPAALMIVPPTLVTYAIIRHQLLDVRTVLHKTALWGLISAITVAPLWILLEYKWHDLTVWGPGGRLAAMLLFYLALVTLLRLVQPRIDHLFDRRAYNLRRVVDDFLDDLRRLKDPVALAASIDHTLRATLYAEFVRVLVLDRETNALLDAHSTASTPIRRGGPGVDGIVCATLERLDRVMSLEELESLTPQSDETAEVARYFRRRGTAVAVPLVHDGEIVGMIEIGEKRNLGSYTRTDFELITRIHSAADVALANSLLYQSLQDLTRSLEERVQARTAELRGAYDQLQELDRLKSRFFTNVTHELRTPLTLILAPLEDSLMERDLDGELRGTIEMIYRQASQLQRLINDLLDLSKIDAGELRLRVAPFNAAELFEQVVSSFQPLATRKSIRLESRFECDVTTLHADRHQLERAIVNLLGNALKFTPPGGEVTLVCRPVDDAMLEVAVQDTGIGIPSQFLTRIFDRFAQVDTDETRRFEGTGVGLALVREIVELHGGSIVAESELGAGSTFRLRLPTSVEGIPQSSIERRVVNVQTGQYRRSTDRDPLAWFPTSNRRPVPNVPQDPEPREERRSGHATEETSTLGRVLVVEDNADLRRYVADLLGAHFHVEVATNGREGLEAATATLPTVVVSDVMMPEMSGLEMCKELKARGETQHIPVILLTAKKGVEQSLEGFDVGADDYITKPFSSRELLARVRVQVKLRQLSEQLAMQEKVSLMGLLSSGLAHEVKNPANAILNAVAPLQRLAPPAPEAEEAVGELFEAINDGARRIVALCDDLLGFARPGEEGIGPWEPKEAIETTLRLLRLGKHATAPVAREFEHNDVPIGSRAQLSQLTMNLLGNALRAAGPDGHVTVRTQNDEDTFYLSVEDDGPGISAENLAKIFEPLFTTQDVGEGTGLGLYIARRVVDLHRGSIAVESSPGQGARFRVALPLRENLAPLSA